MGRLFVGLSGYSFKPWQGEGRFYPVELKANQFLEYYGSKYKTVEMDGSWYKTPTPEAVTSWMENSPEEFQFCFKVHRRITHMARLKPESYEAVSYMCKRIASMAAAGKLGAFLIQLPPNLKKDEERLSAFLACLPTSFDSVEGYTGPTGVRARWCVEFRHDSWDCDSVAEILREKNVAWVASDTDELAATRRDTSDFHYVRIRRTDTNPEQLDNWAEYFKAALSRGQDCFVYCKHEDKGSPWEWADYLLSKF